jgi:acyl-CoA thioester hydrolase
MKPMSLLVNRTAVRVYYEDTDFSGRVYHASFARFFERGRTEWLRQIGFRHDVLAQSQMAFAVKRLEIDFRAPAFIDDELNIETSVAACKGAILRFQQSAFRGEHLLAAGVAEIVTIADNKAIRPPRELIAKLRALGVDHAIDAVAERRETQG